jgi:hypothetical protein
MQMFFFSFDDWFMCQKLRIEYGSRWSCACDCCDKCRRFFFLSTIGLCVKNSELNTEAVGLVLATVVINADVFFSFDDWFMCQKLRIEYGSRWHTKRVPIL